MESLLAIGVGLVLRIVVDVATENDNRVSGVLVGLWEGVVLSHFVRRMPRSFDPYIGFGFRIFVDFLFTQSISRLALVALWALVSMLLADMAPNFWRDSGLRHIYRQVRKDVRHVKRAVPRIRIKNDLPSVRLFNQSRSASGGMSSSIRSDRAAPSRSTAPSPAPSPTPPRRQGPSPPGTFPNGSGWSETGTDISVLQERTITPPGPPPALIPSRERVAYERIDTTNTATYETRTTTVQNTAITIMQTQTQNESVSLETVAGAATLGAATASILLEPIVDPLAGVPATSASVERIVNSVETVRASSASVEIIDASATSTSVERIIDPLASPATSAAVETIAITLAPYAPAVPDDWVDVNHPAPAPPNEPVFPLIADPDSTPEARPSPSTPTPSQPASILIPTPVTINLSSDTPNIDLASQPPDQIPLPESRAASVIGGVFDQPQPRSVLRGNIRSRVDKAASEIGMDHARSHAQATTTKQSKKAKSTLGSWTTGFWSRPSQPADAPEPPPTETSGKQAGGSRLDVSSIVQVSELQLPTPAQVDPPASILSQSGDTPPLLLATVEPERKPEPPRGSKPDQTPISAGVDQGGDTAGPSKTSLFDLPSPSRSPESPPPPFTEFAVPESVVIVGETVVEADTVTQDESPTELTEEQRAAEEKRVDFLLTQVQELERSRADLQARLDKEDDPTESHGKAIKSDLDDAEKMLNDVKARMVKKRFSEPPAAPPIRKLSLLNKSITEIQFAVTSEVLNVLLTQEDAGPMTVQVCFSKQKSLKKKTLDFKDAIFAFAKRHHFKSRFDADTPGTINVMF